MVVISSMMPVAGLVEIDALLDDGLVILVQRQASAS